LGNKKGQNQDYPPLAESREGSVPDLAQAFAQCWRQNTEHAGGQDLVAFAAAHGVFDEELDASARLGDCSNRAKGLSLPAAGRATVGWRSMARWKTAMESTPPWWLLTAS